MFQPLNVQVLLSINLGPDCICLRSNKKISVFRLTGLKILGRVGTHIFLIIIFFLKNNNNFMHFERLSKCIKLYFFPEKPEKNLGFTSKELSLLAPL